MLSKIPNYWNNMDIKKIKVFANDELNDNQMFNIRYGFLNGLDIKKMKEIANKDIHYETMYENINKEIKNKKNSLNKKMF